jgi:dihydrofolate reductase
MRKLISQTLISLDGYFEDNNNGLSWHNVDQEFDNYTIEMLGGMGTLLFGRVTYEIMESFWPTEQAIAMDPIVARYMNELPKVVFSKKLKTATWHNTKVVNENIAEEVQKLKKQPGKDIALFASSNLAKTFVENDLIDEFHFLINPVVLGAGHSFLNGLQGKQKLKLIKSRVFNSGNALLCYEPVRAN